MTEPVSPASQSDDSRSTASKVVGGSLTILSGQVAIKAIAIIFNIAIIRYLGDEQFGKYAICVAFGGLFAVLSDLGLAPLAVKRVARDASPVAAMFSNFLALRLLLAVGVVVLTSGIAWALDFAPEIRLGIFIAALSLLSYAVFGLTDAVAVGRERFRLSASLQVSNHMVFMLLAAAFVFSGSGFLGLLVASAVSPVLVAGFVTRKLNRETPLRAPLEPGTWWNTIRAALPFAAIGIALAISYRADTVILSGFVSVSAIGLYAVAYNLIFTIVNVSHSINLALYPVLTREQTQHPDRAQRLFRDGTRYLLFLSLPFAVFLTFYAEGVVTLLYGQQFAGAATPLAILCWVIPLMYVAEYLGYVAIVVDRESLAARANWVSSASNVAGNLALIPFFGVVAAAAVTVVTEVLLVAQYFWSLRQHGLFSQPGCTFGKTAIASAILAIVAATLSYQQVHVILAGPAAIAVYFTASYVTGAMGRQEYQFLYGLIAGRITARRRAAAQHQATP